MAGDLLDPGVRRGEEETALNPSTVDPALITQDATGAALSPSEKKQKDHYAWIANEYETHYSDPCSLAYRQRFIYDPMFEGLELSGMRVLDAMCGSGQTAEYLHSRNAIVTALDLSEEAIAAFRSSWPESQAVCRSILSSGLESNSFDRVVVIGGLHHLHPHLNEAIAEIHRVLKPGGCFCFMEPHAGSLPDVVRRFWYQHDKYFSDNEAAIDVDALARDFADRLSFENRRFLGNIAFLLVLNSLIFRIPVRLKPFYARPLMAIEGLLNRVLGKSLSCFVVAQMRKL